MQTRCSLLRSPESHRHRSSVSSSETFARASQAVHPQKPHLENQQTSPLSGTAKTAMETACSPCRESTHRYQSFRYRLSASSSKGRTDSKLPTCEHSIRSGQKLSRSAVLSSQIHGLLVSVSFKNLALQVFVVFDCFHSKCCHF